MEFVMALNKNSGSKLSPMKVLAIIGIAMLSMLILILLMNMVILRPVRHDVTTNESIEIIDDNYSP
jgi:hypothetical protein